MGLIMKNGIQYPGVGSGEGSGLEISQLDDVKITTPLADKESLVYNKEIGKWENKKISNESSLPYNLVLSEKWDNNIVSGATMRTVWTSKIFLTKGTYSIYDYVSWQSSMRIYYQYHFTEMSDDFEGCFHGSQGKGQTNVSSDTQGYATFTTNEQFTIIKGTAKIQLGFWGSSGPAYDGGGTVSLYKIDGLNNSSGIIELPIASTETLGGIKVGENLEITEDGTLNAKTSGGSSQVVYGGIDTSNVIYELTSSVEGTEWVATEDCYFIGEFVSLNKSGYLTIDNVPVASNYNTSFSGVYFPIFIIKGQTIKFFAYDSSHISTGKLYGIKKSEKILHEYSTEEKVVGKWIDGKKIYEKVIHVENFIIGDNEIPLENLDTIINYSGNLILTDYPKWKRYFPYTPYNTSNKVAITHYNNTRFVVGSSFKCNTISILMQYTKTTD